MAGHTLSPFLGVKEPADHLPGRLYHLRIPAAREEGSSASAASSAPASLCPVDQSHPRGCDVAPAVVLIGISLVTNDVAHLFACLSPRCIFSLA